MSGQRDVCYNPAPIYDMPGFGIDALPKSFTSDKVVVAATGTNTTSGSIAHGTNGFEVHVAFAAGATACQVEILDADDSDKVLATYAMVPGHGKYFTFFDTRVQVSAHPNVKFRVSGIANAGTVAVSMRPTS
jgi:hypothetical protein